MLMKAQKTLFHDAVAGWFESAFAAPTAAQAEAWPAIKAGRNVLIAAPTVVPTLTREALRMAAVSSAARSSP